MFCYMHFCRKKYPTVSFIKNEIMVVKHFHDVLITTLILKHMHFSVFFVVSLVNDA